MRTITPNRIPHRGLRATGRRLSCSTLAREIRCQGGHAIAARRQLLDAHVRVRVLQQRCIAKGFNMLVRGQADAIWKLQGSFSRLDGPGRRSADRALRRFSALMNTAGDNAGLRIADHAAEAVAQHYSIQTGLLDFTTDPAVALWFAQHGGPGRQDGRHYGIQIPNTLSVGATFVLPPPFVARLHVQQGVFLDMRSISPEALRSACFHFQFSRQNGCGYAVFRLGKKLRLYYHNPWITTAVGAARMSAQAIPAYERGLAVRAWTDDFLRQHPPPSTLRRQYSLWLDETYAALGRLAYAVRTPPEPSTLRVGVWGAFARQNEDICRRLLPRLQAHAEAVQDPVCRGIARSLSDSLDGHP